MTSKGKTPFDIFGRLGSPPGTLMVRLGGDGDPFDLGFGKGRPGVSLLGGARETLGSNLLSGRFMPATIGRHLVDALK